MRVHGRFARYGRLAVGLPFSTAALAQTPVAKFHVRFSGGVDCDQPIQARNIPISGDGTGVLNADGSASADLAQTAFVFSSTVHYYCG